MDVLTISARRELQLDAEQADLLRDVLVQAAHELRAEIVGTDRSEYKRQLREREAVLRSLVELADGPAGAP